MRVIRVSTRDLLFAMENRVPGTTHYLNTETGEVVPVFGYNREQILAEIRQFPKRYVRLTLQVGQDLLWLVEAIYVNILAQILGCPSGRLAESALKKSGRTAEELTSAALPVSPRRLRMRIRTGAETPAAGSASSRET